MSNNDLKTQNNQDKNEHKFNNEFGLTPHSMNTLSEFQYSLHVLSERQRVILSGLYNFWDILDLIYMMFIGLIASYINSLFLPSFITGNAIYIIPIVAVTFITILFAHMTHFPALLSVFSKNPNLLLYSFVEMLFNSWKKVIVKIVGTVAVLLILKTINAFIFNMYTNAVFDSTILKSQIEHYFINGNFYKSMFVNLGILFTAIVIP